MPPNRTTGHAPGDVAWERCDLTDAEAQHCRDYAAGRSYKVTTLAGSSRTIYTVPGSDLAAFLREHNRSGGEEVQSVELAGHDYGRLGAAYHEAGHAVAYWALGLPFCTRVHKEPVDGHWGQTDILECWQEHRLDHQHLCRYMVGLCAGSRAERRFLLESHKPDNWRLAASLAVSGTADRDLVEDMARSCSNLPWAGRVALREEAEAQAIRLVAQHWELIQRVAQDLLMTGEGAPCPTWLTPDDVQRRAQAIEGAASDP